MYFFPVLFLCIHYMPVNLPAKYIHTFWFPALKLSKTIQKNRGCIICPDCKGPGMIYTELGRWGRQRRATVTPRPTDLCAFQEMCSNSILLKEFPIAAMTNHHRLSGIKQHRFIILQFKSSEAQQGSQWTKIMVLTGPAGFLLEALSQISFLCLFPAS